jgi:hypothetical protein
MCTVHPPYPHIYIDYSRSNILRDIWTYSRNEVQEAMSLKVKKKRILLEDDDGGSMLVRATARVPR